MNAVWVGQTGGLMYNHIEPLDPALWFSRIDLIARDRLGDVESSLRHASHLLMLAPAQFRDRVRLAVDEDEFETLLFEGDFDAAARHLVARPAVLAVEATDHRFLATISGGSLPKGAAIGDTIATAVLTAWAKSMLALKSEFDGDFTASNHNQHASQSGQGPLLS